MVIIYTLFLGFVIMLSKDMSLNVSVFLYLIIFALINDICHDWNGEKERMNRVMLWILFEILLGIVLSVYTYYIENTMDNTQHMLCIVMVVFTGIAGVMHIRCIYKKMKH